MWSSRLFWKIFLVIAILNLALLAGSQLLILNWERSSVRDQIRRRLFDTAVVLRGHLMGSDLIDSPESLQTRLAALSRQTGTRITVIDVDGRVIADSNEDPATMENHGSRKELVQARGSGGVGTDERTSATLGIPMYYLALPIQQGDEVQAYVRIAMQLRSINEQVGAVQQFLGSLGVVVELVSLALIYVLVGRIVRPLAILTDSARRIAAGDDQPLASINSGDEFEALAKALNEMRLSRAERLVELEQYSQQLAAVLGSMAEGVVAVAPDERILLANDASRTMLNFNVADPVGHSLMAVSACQPVQAAVQETYRLGNPSRGEFTGPSNRQLSLRTTRLPGDPCPGVMVVLHDITDLRRLENLRQEFVANVSHELKTPLASVKAYAETLRLGAVNDPENNLHFVQRIEEQADRLHQLILDMLRLARIETGQQAFDITVVEIGSVVADCVTDHFESARQKNMKLDVVPPGETVRVQADDDGLRAILDNLVDNAIKYTPAGGTITVSWRGLDGFAELEVADTGIGIAPEDSERIFERFYRVDKARSREVGGTGLGLSIVKHLAQAFGGSVRLESKVGHGSMFVVRLLRG